MVVVRVRSGWQHLAGLWDYEAVVTFGDPARIKERLYEDAELQESLPGELLTCQRGLWSSKEHHQHEQSRDSTCHDDRIWWKTRWS